MSEWFRVLPQIWETKVDVCERPATVRVEAEVGHDRTTWAMRVQLDGAACVRIGGYPSAAHARQSLAEGLLQAIGSQTRSPHR